ncbi:unnamed protein product [Clonostachys rosea f. rosea IK726]|uniref:Uncharacterized protein n=1 Tax=Clonostachys rosea f. rosea IK726 TaxID=1349383 RepID=A0ACA9TNW0_BIOOC|nr:unnamed protein product [Clonostachys rosea f. rosea IK726]
MKFFTVLAWASLALATPTPAIQTRDEDNALCKIFDSLSKLEDTVYASKVKIVAAVDASEPDNESQTAAAIETELETINAALLTAFGSTKGKNTICWPSLACEEDPDVFTCFLETCSAAAETSVDLQAILTAISGLSADIRKAVAEQLGLLRFLTSPFLESILEYCNKLSEQCPIQV